jgi:hypothetical protein
MLINLLLEIGIVLFVLFAAVPVLDVFLSDAQKERFSKEVHHIWYWLDKHSQKSYLLALQRAKGWIVLTGVGLASCYVIWAYFYGRRGETSAGVFEFFVLAALCLLIGWWCVSFTLRATTLFKAIRRGGSVCLNSLRLFISGSLPGFSRRFEAGLGCDGGRA